MTGLLLLLLLLLLAGWFFHCALRLRMARSLPMTMCGIVALLYLFALAGQLRTGVVAVSLLLLLMGGYAFVQTLRHRAWKETAALLLCPECVLFLLAFFAILYVDYGRVADSWDDFSHWADTVKLMFAHDALPTAAMGAQFPSYPPAMALLQYFVQRLGSGGPFTEWKLYAAYHLFAVSLLLPALAGLRWRDGILRILAAAALLLMLPVTLFHDPIGGLSIDCFLGLLFGAALFFCYDLKEKRGADIARFALLLFVLVLSKDVGLLFACLSLLALAVDFFCFQTMAARGKVFRTRWARRICSVGLPALLVAFARISWSSFLLQVGSAAGGGDAIASGVRQALADPARPYVPVIKNYLRELFSFTQRVGTLKISFFAFALFLTALVLLLLRESGAPGPENKRKRAVIWIALASTAVYVASLLLLYVSWSVYSPYEAAQLSSFDRYLNAGFLALLALLSMVWFSRVTEPGVGKRAAALLLVLFLLLMPLPELKELATRKVVRESENKRAPYASAVAALESSGASPDARLLVIAQDTAGLEYQTMRYCLHPKWKLNGSVWSFREPGDTNNIWTTYCAVADMPAYLLERFDGVYLFQLDDYFLTHYENVFAPGTEIREGRWYWVRPDGLLEAAD